MELHIYYGSHLFCKVEDYYRASTIVEAMKAAGWTRAEWTVHKV